MLGILRCRYVVGKRYVYQIRDYDENYNIVSTEPIHISKILKIKPAKYKSILKKYNAQYNDYIGYYFEKLENAQNCLNYLNDVFVVAAKLLN